MDTDIKTYDMRGRPGHIAITKVNKDLIKYCTFISVKLPAIAIIEGPDTGLTLVTDANTIPRGQREDVLDR